MANQLKIDLIVDDKGTVKIKNFGKSVETAGKKGTTSFDGVSKSSNSLNRSLFASHKTLTAMLGAFGGMAAVTTLMKRAVTEAGQFESALTDMGKVTTRSLDEIRTEIEALPPELGTSTELVKSYYQVISAGVTEPKKALETLTVASQTAKAAHMEQSEVIKGLTKIMAGYEGEIKTTAEAADLLFAIEKEGQTSVAELIPIIGGLAKMSRDLGVSQNEMGASLAQITQTAGSTTEAATGYQAVLTALMKPTTDLKTAISSMGYESAQAMIKSEGLSGTLKGLKEYTHGSAEKMAALFSRVEGLKGVSALASQNFEDLNIKIASMTDKTGAAADAWERWEGTWEGIKSTFNNEIINILSRLGEKLLPDIKEGLKNFSDYVTDHESDILKFFGGMIKVIKALMPLVEGLGKAFAFVIEGISKGIDMDKSQAAITQLGNDLFTLDKKTDESYEHRTRSAENFYRGIIKQDKETVTNIIGAGKKAADELETIWMFPLGRDMWNEFENRGKQSTASVSGGMDRMIESMGISIGKIPPHWQQAADDSTPIIEENAEQIKKIHDNMIEGIQSSFSDASYDMFDKGLVSWGDFFGSIGDMFKHLVATMTGEWATINLGQTLGVGGFEGKSSTLGTLLSGTSLGKTVGGWLGLGGGAASGGTAAMGSWGGAGGYTGFAGGQFAAGVNPALYGGGLLAAAMLPSILGPSLVGKESGKVGYGNIINPMFPGTWGEGGIKTNAFETPGQLFNEESYEGVYDFFKGVTDSFSSDVTKYLTYLPPEISSSIEKGLLAADFGLGLKETVSGETFGNIDWEGQQKIILEGFNATFAGIVETAGYSFEEIIAMAQRYEAAFTASTAIVGQALTEAFNVENPTQRFQAFATSIKQQIFDSVKQGIIDAMLQTAVYQQAMAPLMTAIQQGFDEAFTDGIFNAEKFFNIVNPEMENLGDRIKAMSPLFEAANTMVEEIGQSLGIAEQETEDINKNINKTTQAASQLAANTGQTASGFKDIVDYSHVCQESMKDTSYYMDKFVEAADEASQSTAEVADNLVQASAAAAASLNLSGMMSISGGSAFGWGGGGMGMSQDVFGQHGVDVGNFMSKHFGAGQISTQTQIHNTPVNNWDFSGFPHFHEGLAADEFPAVLQKGETVIPKGGAGQSITIIINNKIDAVDGEGVRKVFRDKIIPEIKEAITVNYKGVNKFYSKAVK